MGARGRRRRSVAVEGNRGACPRGRPGEASGEPRGLNPYLANRGRLPLGASAQRADRPQRPRAPAARLHRRPLRVDVHAEPVGPGAGRSRGEEAVEEWIARLREALLWPCAIDHPLHREGLVPTPRAAAPHHHVDAPRALVAFLDHTGQHLQPALLDQGGETLPHRWREPMPVHFPDARGVAEEAAALRVGKTPPDLAGVGTEGVNRRSPVPARLGAGAQLGEDGPDGVPARGRRPRQDRGTGVRAVPPGQQPVT